MKKGLIIIFIIICFGLLGCKKENKTGSREVEDSKYELRDFSNEEYEKSNGVYFSKTLSNLQEPSNYISLEFEISRDYFGYPETVGLIYDFINAGYIDSNITDTKAKETSTLISLSKSSIIDGVGLVSSIKEVSLEEVTSLVGLKHVFHFYELKNPKNIITGTQYDFNLVRYELFDGKEESNVDTNISYDKVVYTFNQYYIYEMLSNYKTGYIPNEGLPCVSIDGDMGFLIRSEYEFSRYNGEGLLSKYEIDYINYDYREQDKPYPYCSIIKKYAEETNYYTTSSTKTDLVEFEITNISKTSYDFISYTNYRKALDNYEQDFNNLYQEIDKEEFERIDINNNPIRSLLNSDINSISKKMESGKSLFKLDFINSGYFLVKYEYEGNVKYYKFNSIDDVDLFHVTKIYYVRSGIITKDLINDTNYNINIEYVIDATQVNTNGMRILNNKYYVKDFTYSYDGLVLILNINDLNNKDDIILGKDIVSSAIYDLKVDNGANLVILKEVTKTHGSIINVYNNALELGIDTLYPIDYLNNLYTDKNLDSFLYSVDLSDVINKIK